ncbi:glycosyltransferase family 4 protein [Gracilimonas sp.]|uniref:glycosyltransferase family 4 protein n=1 Tax=Gracilimonas sp. TaxID=1974203 RepID=UPI0032F06244
MQKVVQLSSVHVVGDARVFYKISSSLAERGYDVDLIIQAEKDFKKNGVSVKSIPLAKTKVHRLFVTLPSLIIKAIDYPKNTIFHFHDPELIVVGLFLKLVGYKVIYDVHEDVPLDVLTKHWIPFWLRNKLSKSIKKIEEFSAKRFDAVITVVPSITERFDNTKVVEIRNYPDYEDYSEQVLQQDASEKYVVYIGDLTSRRGIPGMVEAMEYLDDEVTFKLAGTFSEDGLLGKLKKKKGWRNTEHMGWICQEEAGTLLRGAIAGLLTLEKVPSHMGSLPVKLFEYMMAGIPVISSDVPLWKEIINENSCGIIVDHANPEEIAEAINYLLANPDKAKKMGQNGMKAIKEKYNWQKEKEKLLQLYRELSV